MYGMFFIVRKNRTYISQTNCVNLALINNLISKWNIMPYEWCKKDMFAEMDKIAAWYLIIYALTEK